MWCKRGLFSCGEEGRRHRDCFLSSAVGLALLVEMDLFTLCVTVSHVYNDEVRSVNDTDQKEK